VEAWAVGAAGKILHYKGDSWSLVASPTDVDLHAVQMLSADEGWAVGSRLQTAQPMSIILHYANGVWTKQSTPEGVRLFDIQMFANGEGWAVGQDVTAKPNPDGAILRYKDGTWTREAVAQISLLNSISMTDAGNGWAVGGGAMVRCTNGHWAATDILIAKHGLSKVYATSNDGWAVSAYGGGPILRYQNGTWSAFKNQ